LKTKLLSLALLVIVFCLLIPCVSGSAQITRDKQASTDTETLTSTYQLDPSYYPYTQVKYSVTVESSLTLMYSQLTDAKGQLHINGKASIRGVMHAESWIYDDVRQIWILGSDRSQSSKIFVSVNELTLDSETQTSQEIRILANRITMSALDLDTGQTVTVDNLIIEHVMIKLSNGEVQFLKSWEFVHN
jgi:hypothetical protein